MYTESGMLSNHLTLCCPLLLLPSIFPSIRVFSNEPALRIRWPKYWNLSFSISPSNEYSGLTFTSDQLDLLAVQGTLKSLLQYQNFLLAPIYFHNFYITPKESLHPLSNGSHPLSCQPLKSAFCQVQGLLSVCMNLYILEISCKWNYTAFVLLCLAYFTQHNVLRVHPCCSVGQNFLPFQAE